MKALFLDRDGVINRRLPGEYVRTPAEFELLDDIVPILELAQRNNYHCIVISNQQGVGKGLMSWADLNHVTEYMQTLLQKKGLRALDAIYYCTDLDGTGSKHRKPEPGMILEAIAEHRLSPEECWFIGDSITDAQAGQAAGVHTALVGDFQATAADMVAQTLPELLVSLRRNLTAR